MKTIILSTVWEASHEIEVPGDFEVPAKITDFPREVLEQITSETASLVDWE